MKKVLFVESRRLCYGSSYYLIDRLSRFFKQKKIEVEFFDYDALCNDPQKLETFSKKSFDAIFDINSQLPGIYQDDTLFLEQLDIPFFHRILDHPLHLHPSLQGPYQKECVICLDEHHKRYLQKKYPHIHHVIALPFLAKVPEKQIPFSKRKYAFLFPATYIPLSYLEDQIKERNASDLLIAKEILSLCIQGSREDFENLYKSLAKEDEKEMDAERMYRVRFVDRYVRAGLREFVLEQFASHDIVMDIVGDNWEYSQLYKNKAFHFHPSCSYQESLSYIANAKTVLNVEPLFREAMHDRITNAFCCGAVVVSDPCEALETNFTDRKEYLGYHFAQLKTQDSFWKLLQAEEKLEEIAIAGQKKYRSLYAYENRMEMLLKELEKAVQAMKKIDKQS